MTGQIDEIKKKIIQLLYEEKRPATTEYICNKLNIPKSLASLALYSLLKEGVIKRIYTDNYDPTRPFDTASWILEEKYIELTEVKEVAKLKYIQLVLSVPLFMLNQRTRLLNQYEALDFHDAYTHIIEIANQELKIICPVIDVYALFPLVTKIINSEDLKIKILTEISKSKDIIYLLGALKFRNIEIRDVARTMRYGGYERKMFGIHAKIIIADNEVVLIGSFNLSKHHYLVNFDIGFIIYDKGIVKKLSLLFDELWNYAGSTS